jgi:hypothetical protein
MTSSDESSFDASSTGPTTPEWSPYLLPQTAGSDARPTVNFGAHNIGPSALQDQPIRNVCVIGAGYVGKAVISANFLEPQF